MCADVSVVASKDDAQNICLQTESGNNVCVSRRMCVLAISQDHGENARACTHQVIITYVDSRTQTHSSHKGTTVCRFMTHNFMVLHELHDHLVTRSIYSLCLATHHAS